MAVSLWLVFVLATAISHCGVSGSRYSDTFPLFSNNNPIVRTTHGYVQGKTEIVQDKFGHFVEVDGFWGIPYAEKPVGDLRFRPPVPIYPWDGVYQARTPPNSCMQVLGKDLDLLSNTSTLLSEDCLYLNIWRPRTKKHNAPGQYREDTDYSTNQTTTQKTGLATMVWITSELFTTGSSTIDTFNGAMLAASENVLVASINFSYKEGNKDSIVVNYICQVEPTVLVLQYKNLTSNYIFWMASVVDGYFQDPFITLDNGAFKHRSVLAGSTQGEGTFEMSVVWPHQFSYREEPMLLSAEGNCEQVKDYLRLVIQPEYVLQVLQDVKAVYEFDRFGRDIKNVSLELLNDIIGDFSFQCPLRLLATAYAKVYQNVYLYLFDHRPDITNLAKWTGVFHSSELPFVFGTETLAIPGLSPREVNLRQTVMTYWGNFAKFGCLVLSCLLNPTPDYSDGPTWHTYNPPDPGKILVFTESAGVQVGQTEVRRRAYWNSLPRSVLFF